MAKIKIILLTLFVFALGATFYLLLFTNLKYRFFPENTRISIESEKLEQNKNTTDSLEFNKIFNQACRTEEVNKVRIIFKDFNDNTKIYPFGITVDSLSYKYSFEIDAKTIKLTYAVDESALNDPANKERLNQNIAYDILALCMLEENMQTNTIRAINKDIILSFAKYLNQATEKFSETDISTIKFY